MAGLPGWPMTTVKLILSAWLGTILVLSGAKTEAQAIGGIPFSEVDINGDGLLDAAELLAAFDAAA